MPAPPKTRRYFRETFPKLLPYHFVGEKGTAVTPATEQADEAYKMHYSLMVLLDAFLERSEYGLTARFPSYAPRSALVFLGRDRRVRRGRNETDERYAARLKLWRAPLDGHKTRGTRLTLLRQIRAWIGADIMVRVVDTHGTWATIEADGTEVFHEIPSSWVWDPASADTSKWSRFWVIIYPSGGQPCTLLGLDPANPTWGSTLTGDEVSQLRTVIREHKPAGTRCEWIILAGDASSFDPDGTPEPDATWFDSGDANGAPNRLTTARYIKGEDGALLTS